MNSRVFVILGTIVLMLFTTGFGRLAAADSAYIRPTCIYTFGRGGLVLDWLTEARWLPDKGLYALAKGDSSDLSVADAGVGDHWNVAILEFPSGEELWRKDGISPLEAVTIPASVWTVDGLYTVKTERWFTDGRMITGSLTVEMTDPATAQSLREITKSLDEFLHYNFSPAGAVRVRVTLRDEATGKEIMRTQLDPVPGITGNGLPVIQMALNQYLNESHIGKRVKVTWEELDAAGRTLLTTEDPIRFTVRASLAPHWKEGGGQVLPPMPTLEWESVSGARWYRISVPGVVEAVVPGDTTQYQFTTPLEPGIHWVNIASEGGGCSQDWGDALQIVVDQLPWRGILSPEPGALTTRDLTVKLRRADWIHGYKVELIDAQSQRVLQVRDLFRSQAGDTVRFATEHLIPGHAYRIRATTTLAVPVPQVDDVHFTYQPPIRLAFKEAPQGARVAKANLPLSWEPIPGATGYTVLLTKVSTFVNLQTRHAVGNSTSYTLRGAELESGRTYRLVLQATMADGSTMTADPVTFTVQ